MKIRGRVVRRELLTEALLSVAFEIARLICYIWRNQRVVVGQNDVAVLVSLDAGRLLQLTPVLDNGQYHGG